MDIKVYQPNSSNYDVLQTLALNKLRFNGVNVVFLAPISIANHTTVIII